MTKITVNQPGGPASLVGPSNCAKTSITPVMRCDGHITERGTHTELLAADGHYADLYRTQAHAYR